MKNIMFVSDTHIDQRLRSGTTVTSREKLRQIRFETLMSVLDNPPESCNVIDAGDVFHAPTVQDNVGLSYALRYLYQVDHVIAGNHDLSARIDVTSTLHAIADSVDTKVHVSPFAGAAKLHIVDDFVLLPHVRNQEVFLAGLEKAMATEAKYLVTHCNILLGEKLLTPTTLNLDAEWMDKLANRFTRVFIGHNHKPAEYNGGRIVSIGTPYPSSFSDCHHDGRVLMYNTETDKLQSIYTYRAADEYTLISPEDPIPVEDCPQFVRLIGDWNPERLIQVYDELYAAGALAIKVEGMVAEDVDMDRDEVLSALSALDFKDLVSAILTEEDQKLLEEIESEV